MPYNRRAKRGVVLAEPPAPVTEPEAEEETMVQHQRKPGESKAAERRRLAPLAKAKAKTRSFGARGKAKRRAR